MLKKCNAVLSLLTFAAMLLHVGYTGLSYMMFYYNPDLTKAFAIPFIILTCLHAIAGMCSVFLQSDGTRADLYPKKNMRTIIQRVSSALIFPMLLLHLKTFDLAKSAAESDSSHVLFFLVILSEVLFFFVIACHSSVSFSKALITLGALRSAKAMKITDTIVYIVCTLLFSAATFFVVKTQISMFMIK